VLFLKLYANRSKIAGMKKSRALKFLIVADPLSHLKPATDTTLAIVRSSVERKHGVWWATGDDLYLENGKVRVRARRCVNAAPDALPECGQEEDRAVRDFSAVWIRKDPPFDASYVSLCWILGLEESNVPMLNAPSLLLRYHEKLVPFEAVAAGFLKLSDTIPTHIGDAVTAKKFLQAGNYDPAIRKPFLGFAGADVKKFSLKAGDPLPKQEALELSQPFLPEISTVGDRRVFFLGGKWIGDFVRLPKQGEIVSNIARGGTAHLVPMNARQKAVTERLGRFLKKSGIVFAGADMIGNRISEVNVTSPTGLRSLESVGGPDLGPKIVAYVERLAQ
jgi:glutathione synthase